MRIAMIEKAEEEARTRARNEERVKEETQRRAIQDALNKQTFQQFRSYAEQQYPGRPRLKHHCRANFWFR